MTPSARVFGRGRKGLGPALVACGLVLLVGLSGCAGSGYTYVSSTSTGTFFKVPAGWKVYNQSAVLAHNNGSVAGGRARLPFFAFIDADPKPSLDHQLPVSSHPLALARVRALSANEQDSYSLASLRNEAFNLDSLLQSDANAVQTLSAPKLLLHQGLRGYHIEYTVHNPDHTTFSVDQEAFVDAPTHTVWLLVVGCQSACYAQNTGAIHRVADSWTVKGK